MTSAPNPPKRPRCKDDQVYFVLGGRTADGTDPLPWKLSFAKDFRTRYAAMYLGAYLLILQELIPAVHDSEQARTALIFKLLSHLSRTGRQTEASINAFYPQVDAAIRVLVEHPELITSPVNFSSILNRARPPRDTIASMSRDAPPRNVVWTSADKTYRLEELTHPLHVLIEGLRTHNCIARLYDDKQLRTLHLLPATPAAAPHLVYWRAIHIGEMRLFSLTGRPPRITISFINSPWSLADVRAPCNAPVTSQLPNFTVVVEALSHIAATFGPFTLQNLDHPIHNDLYRALRPLQFPLGRPPLPQLPRVIA